MPEFAALGAESPSARAEHFGAVLEDSQATLALAALVVHVDGEGAVPWRRDARVEGGQRSHGATLGAGGSGVCTLRDAASEWSRLDGLLPMDNDVSEGPLTASRTLGRRADHGFRTLLESTDRKVQRNEPIGAAVRAKDQGVADPVTRQIPTSVRKGRRRVPRSLEVLGQYWANISGQLRRYVALPGRSLEFRRRFFRSF